MSNNPFGGSCALFQYMYRNSERHVVPGTLPRVRGTNRTSVFPGSFLVLGRIWSNVSHQARGTFRLLIVVDCGGGLGGGDRKACDECTWQRPIDIGPG